MSRIVTTGPGTRAVLRCPRFEEHGLSPGDQFIHQRIDVLLQQRFSAGHLNQRTVISLHLRHDVGYGAFAPFMEGVQDILSTTSSEDRMP